MGKMKLGYLFVSSLLILILLSLELELWMCAVATNSTTLCIQRERAALLTFKATLYIPEYSTLLPSWNSSNRDCCSWEAVTCHKITGHVITLDLTQQGNNPYEDRLVAKAVDSSLLELKYLTYLDLSRIEFYNYKFPAYLGSLKQLQYLNLSDTCFSGVVPQNLGNLSSLRALDLSGGLFDELKVDDLMWATRLSSLEYLDISGVNLSMATNVFEVFNTIPSLLFLSLSSTDLDNTHLPHSSINNYTSLANVRHLDLSQNSFHGEFPHFLPNMTSLTFLDLSWNTFNPSSGTHWLGLKLLTHLKLAAAFTLQGNKVDISGLFKNFSCHKIENLSLRGNNFYGEFPQELGELSFLMDLGLSQNHFTGAIPTLLGNLSALTSLDVSYNNFSGPLPSSLANLTSLRSLRLSRNQLSGEIPISLGELSQLESIDISFNSLETTLSEAHFAKLSKLEELELSFNKMIRFGVGSDWVPPFQLTRLYLRSSEVGGRFPQWLQTQKALEWLDLSNCSIGGTFPAWLHSLISLTDLDLSDNNISGPIPKLSSSTLQVLFLSNNMITHLPTNIGYMIPHLEYLRLARNLINTSIPDSICQIKNLTSINLSRNRFSGNLPNCNWSSFEQLRTASFSSNELTGVIPNSIGEARSLTRLRLDGNRLTGKLPSTLKNCEDMDLLDVGGNNLSGKFPKWIGKHLLSLEILRLRNNDFSGPVPRELCRLSRLQVLDIANNNLTGSIPYCFDNFSAMMITRQLSEYGFTYSEGLNQVIKGVEQEYKNIFYVVNMDLSNNHLVGEIPWELTNLSGLVGLNLSYNHLGGQIPANIGDMKLLESLDLSNNNLEGVIPYSLSSLSFLSWLNLSNNNLSGQIPGGQQLQTLDDPTSIYQGNPLLCGAPLQRKCDEPGIAPDVQNHKEEDDEDKADMIWFYGIIIAGFATGFWAVIGAMVVKTKWRQAYFRYIEVVMARMLGY